MPTNRHDLDAVVRAQRAVAGTARALLQGEIGVLAAARELWRLGHEVVPDWRVDPDFRCFGAIDSETDHLPLEAQRPLWAPAAFAARQQDVVRAEALYREEALAAAVRLVDRFGGV